jgi:hypothetical protein
MGNTVPKATTSCPSASVAARSPEELIFWLETLGLDLGPEMPFDPPGSLLTETAVR